MVTYNKGHGIIATSKHVTSQNSSMLELYKTQKGVTNILTPNVEHCYKKNTKPIVGSIVD
jgi:hypothetical protein